MILHFPLCSSELYFTTDLGDCYDVCICKMVQTRNVMGIILARQTFKCRPSNLSWTMSLSVQAYFGRASAHFRIRSPSWIW